LSRCWVQETFQSSIGFSQNLRYMATWSEHIQVRSWLSVLHPNVMVPLKANSSRRFNLETT
jgi:hypothetical protein